MFAVWKNALQHWTCLRYRI